MSRPTELDSLKATITKEELEGKMRVWGETTTTSPSGRHLGHYKDLFIQSQVINRIQILKVWGMHDDHNEDDELNWIDPKK